MPDLPPFNNPPPRPEVMPSVPPPLDGEPLPAPPDRWQGTRTLAAWSLRWALLGVGMGGAWLFGLLVAQFFPDPTPTPPAQEVVARRTSRFFQKLGRLPDWWAGETGPVGATPSASPGAIAPATPTPAASRPIALSDAEREQVTVELDALRDDLQRLRDRASALERQLGLPTLELGLEDRLNNATQRLSPPTESPPPTPPTPALQPAAGAVPDPLFQVNAYRVTLPSDVLFTPGDTLLQPNAQPLLDSILPELGRYPGATILVGSYTDVALAENPPSAVSYQQAIAVQRYLAQRLGNDSVRWVAIGYGNSNLGSTGGVQLSRRITIAIVP